MSPQPKDRFKITIHDRSWPSDRQPVVRFFSSLGRSIEYLRAVRKRDVQGSLEIRIEKTTWVPCDLRDEMAR